MIKHIELTTALLTFSAFWKKESGVHGRNRSLGNSHAHVVPLVQ